MTTRPLTTPATDAAARPAPTVDVHQHLWPREFVSALSARSRPPFLATRHGGPVLVSDGEPEWPFDEAAHDVEARRDAARGSGDDVVLVAPSCPIGVEALPAREALPLVDAYHRGVAHLPRPFRPWATAALAAPDPRGLADLLADGFAGLCLPAGAFSDPAGPGRVAALLDVLEDAGAPLFIHPGPSPWSPAPAHPAGAEAWWPALTHYVFGMQTAWHVVQAHVRPVRPALRIVFAMLAGLAPLQADRMRLRGDRLWRPHPATFLETSSYGPETVRAVAAVTGPRSIVHGSDRPVAVPPFTPADGIRRANPTLLLRTTEVTT